MKDESRSPRSTSTPLPVRHQLDHAVPTVIHDPEQDLPLLARWLRRAMANPTQFWSLIGGIVVVVTGLAIFSSGLSLGRKSADSAWLKVETARTPADRVEIAHQYPKTPAEQWALLSSASDFYNQGFVDLPANRDAALPAFKKALDLFDEVAREAPRDSPQARAAALGAGRTLEARNELEKAIKQYEKVAETWKGTPEAAEAQRLAQTLRQPESAAFYKELYAFRPTEAILPPGGQGNFPMTLPPSLGGSSKTTPFDLPFPMNLPPPPPPSPTSAPASEPPASGAVPAPSTTAPAEAPKSELPADPFAAPK